MSGRSGAKTDRAILSATAFGVGGSVLATADIHAGVSDTGSAGILPASDSPSVTNGKAALLNCPEDCRLDFSWLLRVGA